MFSVIFDIDGTMLDTQKICIPAWEWAGRNQGFNGLGRDVPDVCGMNKACWTRYLKEKYPTLDTDRFNLDSRQYVIQHIDVKYMPGAEELLKFLKKNGIKSGHFAGMKCIGVPDIVDFCDEVNDLLFAKYKRIDESIEMFDKLLKSANN